MGYPLFGWARVPRKRAVKMSFRIALSFRLHDSRDVEHASFSSDCYNSSLVTYGAILFWLITRFSSASFEPSHDSHNHMAQKSLPVLVLSVLLVLLAVASAIAASPSSETHDSTVSVRVIESPVQRSSVLRRILRDFPPDRSISTGSRMLLLLRRLHKGLGRNAGRRFLNRRVTSGITL